MAKTEKDIIEKIRKGIEDCRTAIQQGNQEAAEKYGRQLVDWTDNITLETEEDATRDIIVLQHDLIETIFEIHLMRGNRLDCVIRFIQLTERIKRDKEHFVHWAPAEWDESESLIKRALTKLLDFIKGQNAKTDKPHEIRTSQHKCLLCRSSLSTKTGSHMVPHFLISQIFTYDGSSRREKVVVTEDRVAESNKDFYFGREVYEDGVQSATGKKLTDEQLEEQMGKTNPLVLDYVFCPNCENRFGTIESYYSDIMSGKTKDYPPGVPYLFWISVVWRMAIGELGMCLNRKEKEALRNALNKCLATNRKDLVFDQKLLGHGAYLLAKAEDTRDELLGILSYHFPTQPYLALIGNLALAFFPKIKAAKQYADDIGVNRQYVNNGRKEEEIIFLNFIEFWKIKRSILDENWEYDRSLSNIGRPLGRILYRTEQAAVSPEDFLNDESHFTEVQNLDDLGVFSESPRLIKFPLAIQKIMAYMNKNPEDKNLNGLMKATGYSEEELNVFMQYFIEMINVQDPK